LHPSFFVRLGIPFLRPDPQYRKAGALISRHSPLSSFIPVSLFDLDRRFFGPTRSIAKPAHFFHCIIHFLPSSQFLCSTWNPVSSPRPAVSQSLRSFSTALSSFLLHPSFFVRLGIPFLRPDPQYRKAGALISRHSPLSSFIPVSLFDLEPNCFV